MKSKRVVLVLVLIRFIRNFVITLSKLLWIRRLQGQCHDGIHRHSGWSAGNLNRPIRIQQARKMLVSWCKVDKSGKALKSGTFLTGDGVRYCLRKGIFNFRNHTSWQKLKSMKHFVFLNFYFGAKNARHGNSLLVRRVSQGMITIVLFWTRYAVPRQI